MSVTDAQMKAMLAAQNAGPTSKLYKSYYAYNLIFPSIASGASLNANAQIQSDAAFMVQAISAYCWDLTGNTTIYAVDLVARLQITLQSSGTTFYDQPTPISSLAGNGQFPFVMPEARILPANSVISGTLYNDYSPNAFYYTITLHGKKVYNISQ